MSRKDDLDEAAMEAQLDREEAGRQTFKEEHGGTFHMKKKYLPPNYKETLDRLGTTLSKAIADDKSSMCLADMTQLEFGKSVSEWLRSVAEEITGKKRPNE